MTKSIVKQFQCSRHWSLSRRLAYYTAAPNENGCKLWIGGQDMGGYGRLQWKGKARKAHRLTWKSKKGPIPKGLCVCHRCDVRLCQTEDHLFLGTTVENTADRTKKGRAVKGAASPLSKLTDDDIRAIRADPRSQTAIAAAYGIIQPHVSRIKRRVAWAHI